MPAHVMCTLLIYIKLTCIGKLHLLKTLAALKNFIDSDLNSSESEQSFNSEKNAQISNPYSYYWRYISIHFTGQGTYSRKINQL